MMLQQSLVENKVSNGLLAILLPKVIKTSPPQVLWSHYYMEFYASIERQKQWFCYGRNLGRIGHINYHDSTTLPTTFREVDRLWLDVL